MKRALVWLVMAVCALASALHAGERPMASLAPADAFLTVWYDGGHEGFRKTPLSRFFEEPEVVAALKQFAPLGRYLVRQFNKGARGDLWPAARVLVGCEAMVAIGAPLPAAASPSVILVVRVGARDGPARQAAEQYRKVLLANALPGTARTFELNGLTFQSVQARGGPMVFGFAGEFFILASDKRIVVRALDAAAPRLALAVGHEHALLRVRYDHRALLKAFPRAVAGDPQVMHVLDALGISAIRAADFALVPRGERLVTRLEVDVPDAAKRVGLTKLLADSPPVDRELLKLVPRDSMIFLASSMDFAGAWDELWATVARIDPRAAADATQGLGDFEAQLGVRIRQELLGPLDRGTLLVETGGGAVRSASILVQRTRDPAALEAAIRRLVGGIQRLMVNVPFAPQGGVELRASTYRGQPFHYVWMTGNVALRLPGFAPCFARRGKLLVAAGNVLDLKSYLDFLIDGGPTILDNPRYRALEAAVPKDAAMISYAAWPDTLAAIYNTLAPLVQFVQGVPDLPDGMQLDLADLPSSRLLRRYARGSILYSVFEKGRYRAELQGDGIAFLTPQVAPVAAVAVLAGMTLPALARARGEARRIRDRNNLNMLVRGVATYLNQFGENRFYPGSIGELWDKRVIADPGVFVSPLDPAPPKLPNGLACSYVSAFDRHPRRQFRDDFPPNVMMAWDRISFPGSRGFRNVVFFDSHVEWVPEARFQQLLRQLDENVRRRTQPRAGKF